MSYLILGEKHESVSFFTPIVIGAVFRFASWLWPCSGAAREGVRAVSRPGRERCGVGADTPGVGRQDARHGESDTQRLRDRSWLQRRAHGNHRREARRQSAALNTTRIWSSYRSAMPPKKVLATRPASSKPICSKLIFPKHRSLPCFCCQVSTRSCARRFSTLSPALASCRTPSTWRIGKPTRLPQQAAATIGARRISGSFRRKSVGRGNCRKEN